MNFRIDQGDPAQQASAPPPVAPEPSKPWYRRRLTGILAIGGAILAFPAAKFAIGFLAASVVSGAVSGAFGTPWERLPSDIRAGFEARLEDAYGGALDDLSEDPAAQRVETDVRHGMLRLDDEVLVRRLRLFSAALTKVAVADCADFARTSFAVESPAEEVVKHLAAALDAAEFESWIEIAVQAVEAERRGSPEVRSVPDAQQAAAFQAVIATLSAAQLQLLQDVVGDPSGADEEVCSAIRSIYAASLEMDPSTLAIIAFADVAQAP